MIAVFTTDFNPADSYKSRIKYWENEEKLLVRWEHLSLYASSWEEYTFTCEIRRSGAIRFHLDSIRHPSQVPDAPGWTKNDGWLVGLRFDDIQANRTTVTETQALARNTWLSGAGEQGHGVYVNKSWIMNHTRIDFCPISTRWCMSPSNASSSSIINEKINLTFSAAIFGCDSDIMRFRCTFQSFRNYDIIYISAAANDFTLQPEVKCAFPSGLVPGNGTLNSNIQPPIIHCWILMR